MLCLHLTVFMSRDTNLTSLLLTTHELNMCISTVPSEKSEGIQLQENRESIQLYESSKTILDNYKQHRYKKLRH